jgi:hypothetical protein
MYHNKKNQTFLVGFRASENAASLALSENFLPHFGVCQSHIRG